MLRAPINDWLIKAIDRTLRDIMSILLFLSNSHVFPFSFLKIPREHSLLCYFQSCHLVLMIRIWKLTSCLMKIAYILEWILSERKRRRFIHSKDQVCFDVLNICWATSTLVVHKLLREFLQCLSHIVNRLPAYPGGAKGACAHSVFFFF